MKSRKFIAATFLQMASSGKIVEAFAQYVHPHFTHHNPYFKGDRESFLQAMIENSRQFPNKSYQALRILEDSDLVAIHGKVILAPELEWSVIHIFRFEGEYIIESWEASQQVIKDSPNVNGIF
ncbi:MAG: nuclear transport factor 2 family protein [Thermoflavifilum sp.]|nr:nuclear transport factor 2 family protein [Thermoflavifilum sp.]